RWHRAFLADLGPEPLLGRPLRRALHVRVLQPAPVARAAHAALVDRLVGAPAFCAQGERELHGRGRDRLRNVAPRVSAPAAGDVLPPGDRLQVIRVAAFTVRALGVVGALRVAGMAQVVKYQTFTDRSDDVGVSDPVGQALTFRAELAVTVLLAPAGPGPALAWAAPVDLRPELALARFHRGPV